MGRNIYTAAPYSGAKVENQTRKFIKCSGECSINVPPMFRGMFRPVGSKDLTVGVVTYPNSNSPATDSLLVEQWNIQSYRGYKIEELESETRIMRL